MTVSNPQRIATNIRLRYVAIEDVLVSNPQRIATNTPTSSTSSLILANSSFGFKPSKDRYKRRWRSPQARDGPTSFKPSKDRYKPQGGRGTIRNPNFLVSNPQRIATNICIISSLTLENTVSNPQRIATNRLSPNMSMSLSRVSNPQRIATNIWMTVEMEMVDVVSNPQRIATNTGV